MKPGTVSFAVGIVILAATSAQATGGSGGRPAMRWDHLPGSQAWTDAALQALQGHGAALAETTPADIANYCPGYVGNKASDRQAFWAGLASALAKHESTWRPDAVGGGGRWFGLLQIAPGTAQAYGCKARTGPALSVGADNLSCAIRIWSSTVPRDGVISAGMKGVAADWGPFHSSKKRQDIMAWTRSQDYCKVTKTRRKGLFGLFRRTPASSRVTPAE